MAEKKISYQTTNSYSTLNERTVNTKNVWVVFHGLGYLSRYFLKNFKSLNPEENYIIAPQAPSKYYLNDEYRHVGASWLTKENTSGEMENILRYLDEIYAAEELSSANNLIILGYSQGVSIASRWIARQKPHFSELIIHSGKIPVELKTEDLQLPEKAKVKLLYGTQDPFLSKEVLASERERAQMLFGEKLEIIPFEGKHEVNVEFLENWK